MSVLLSIGKFLGIWFLLFFVSIAISVPVGQDRESVNAAIAIFAIVISPIVSYLVVRSPYRKRRRGAAILLAREKDSEISRRKFLERERLIDCIEIHRTAILRNLERAVKKNDYGVTIEDKTLDAVSEFFASIELDMSLIPFDEAEDLMFERIDFHRQTEREKGFERQEIPTDGVEFERWVAESLSKYGWEAVATQASGDQGIDVIARRSGVSVGIQCKLYATPVGNKAVQEAHSGRVFHRLDAAAVLTNATFTRSARDLARMTGVLLLTPHDIPTLELLVSERARA